jgi:anti-sigma factor RsiW
MNFDAETEQKIDRYLRREMAAQEMEAFEQRMQQEPELVEEMILRRDIILGIRAAEHEHIRRSLEAESADLSGARTGGDDPEEFARYLKRAIIALLTLGAIFVLYRSEILPFYFVAIGIVATLGYFFWLTIRKRRDPDEDDDPDK